MGTMFVGFSCCYLLIYLAGWALGTPVSVLSWVFVGFHCGLLFFVGRTGLRWLRRADRSEILFWFTLFASFIVTGAYLEYPSDPVEHFRRIFSWQNVAVIQESPVRMKMGYFWAWTWMSWLPILWRRVGLDLFSACIQLVVALQVFRFSRRLGFDRNWSFLQVVGFLLLFGHNAFSFRYYALSTTPLAYAAYLQFLILVWNVFDGKREPLWAVQLFLLFGWAFFNHVQEALFCLMMGTALFGIDWLKRNPQYRVLAIRVGIVVIALGFVFGRVAYSFSEVAYRPLGRESISLFGTFRIWEVPSPFMETWGVHGLVALGLGIIFLRKIPEIVTLTFVPVFLLVFPPAVLVIERLFYLDSIYRVLYAMPTSFLLVAGFREISVWVGAAERKQLIFAASLVLVLAAPARYPWRGRLFFQLYRPPAALTLSALDESADWLAKNRSVKHHCRLLADDSTSFMLTAHLGSGFADHDRLSPIEYLVKVEAPYRVRIYLATYHACGVLVAVPDRLPERPFSRMARLSGHWRGELVDLRRGTSAVLLQTAEQLVVKYGWIVRDVPPYYRLYEPPDGKIPDKL